MNVIGNQEEVEDRMKGARVCLSPADCQPLPRSYVTNSRRTRVPCKKRQQCEFDNTSEIAAL